MRCCNVITAAALSRWRFDGKTMERVQALDDHVDQSRAELLPKDSPRQLASVHSTPNSLASLVCCFNFTYAGTSTHIITWSMPSWFLLHLHLLAPLCTTSWGFLKCCIASRVLSTTRNTERCNNLTLFPSLLCRKRIVRWKCGPTK